MAIAARSTPRSSDKPPTGGRSQRVDYAFASTRPLHVLVFLLPLVLLYELGSAFYLSASDGSAAKLIRAERLLSSFFELFGVGGLYLPGVLLIIILFIWHVLTGDRWRVRPAVPVGMAVESLFWTLPLLVVGQLVFRLVQAPPHLAAPVDPAVGGLAALSKPALATIAVGAGLYEELLFRLVGIVALHAVAADLLRIRDASSKAIAVFFSAVAFAFYHDLGLPAGGIDPARLAIYTLAGVYFGTIFVLRGFGIVVAVHVCYDLAVLVLLPK